MDLLKLTLLEFSNFHMEYFVGDHTLILLIKFLLMYSHIENLSSIIKYLQIKKMLNNKFTHIKVFVLFLFLFVNFMGMVN